MTLRTGRKCGGFTLVELLVVLVILGLIMAMAPAAFHRMMPGVALRSSALSVAAVFREARTQAIRDNRELVVIIDTAERSLRVGERGREHRFEDDLAFALLTATSEQLDENRGAIRFYPDGTSTGGRLTLSVDERRYEVDVDWLTGRVRVNG